jgi:hypothetical protein
MHNRLSMLRKYKIVRAQSRHSPPFITNRWNPIGTDGGASRNTQVSSIGGVVPGGERRNFL